MPQERAAAANERARNRVERAMASADDRPMPPIAPPLRRAGWLAATVSTAGAALRRAAGCGAVLLVALGATAPAAPAAEASPEAAAAFVESLFDRARHLSARTKDGDPERYRQLLAFVRSGVDLIAIARFSTGPFWKQASPYERERFLAVFETFVAQTFDRRLGELSGHSLKIVKAV